MADRMADSKLCAGCQRSDKDIKAVSLCNDCSELVCKACARVHNRMSLAHKEIPKKDIQQLSSSLFKLSKNCENHTDQAISLFCGQHDKLVCASCVRVSHQNCKSIISIEKAAKGVKDSTAISGLEKRLSNLCQVTEIIRSQRETTLVHLVKSRNRIKKRVSKLKHNMIARLDTLEAELHKDIDYNYKNCTESVSQNRNNIQSSSDSLSTWKNYLKSLKQQTSEVHLFHVVKFLDAKTYQKELEIRKIKTATFPMLKYNSLDSESNIQKFVPYLGTITVENVQVPMPLLDIDQQCQFLVGDERMLPLARSIQTTVLGDRVKINRACFFSDSRLLLCNYSDKQLFVCALDGSNFNVIDLDYVPFNISSYEKNHAVVSVGDAGIQIIDLTTLKPGKRMQVDGSCTGITSVKEKIWVRNQSHSLTKMDINGKVLKVIRTTFDPDEIFVNQDGDVYCTDRYSDNVHVVTSDGKEREVYKSPELNGAYGVVIDDRGDVFVAGYESNNIHRISNDEQKHVIVLIADDGISRPSALFYNNETKELLVVNDYSKTINIYKTQ